MLGKLGQPYAYLQVCRFFTGNRQVEDIAHIAGVLGVESDPREELDGPGRTNTQGVWLISTEGKVRSSSVREHVRWLIDRVGGYGSLAPLKERYMLSVFFFDYVPPDPAEREAVDQELERHGISFDFELERDDFP